MNEYVWHENIRVINDYEPDRRANLLLPAGVECPAEITETDFQRLYPGGASLKVVSFFCALTWIAVPKTVEPCVLCQPTHNAYCDECGGTGYVSLPDWEPA